MPLVVPAEAVETDVQNRDEEYLRVIAFSLTSLEVG